MIYFLIAVQMFINIVCIFILISKIKERKKEEPKLKDDLDKFKDY